MTINQAEPQAGKSTPWSNDQLIQALGNKMFQEWGIDNNPYQIILSTDRAAIERDYWKVNYIMTFDNETFEVNTCTPCNMFEWGHGDEFVVVNEEDPHFCLYTDPDNNWVCGQGDFDNEIEGFRFINEHEMEDYNEIFMLVAYIESEDVK